MKFDTPTKTVLFSIEEASKAYRKLCQHNISEMIPDITVDQALILIIADKSEITPSEISDLIFKDYASMTRIINLMVTKNYLIKNINSNDKRKIRLKITKKGRYTIRKLGPLIKLNRKTALKGISINEQKEFFKTLKKITNNCQIPSQA